MKRAGLLLLLFILGLNACTHRKDLVFSASSDLYYIDLYRDSAEFEILYNGLNTATGNYQLHGDTVFLNYDDNQDEGVDWNADLVRILYIDRENGKISGQGHKAHFVGYFKPEFQLLLQEHP